METLTHWFWQFGVTYFLYVILILISFWIAKSIMFSSIKEKYIEWNYRYRIRTVRNQVSSEVIKNYQNPFVQNINILLRTTRKGTEPVNVQMFLGLSGIMGVASWIFILYIMGDIVIATIASGLIASIPYLVLQLRLSKVRYAMSNDFLQIVQSLTRNYNANQFDMYYALTETQKDIKSPILRKVIINLITDLQLSRNDYELQESIQVFVYTSGTSWAKRLGSIIIKAYSNSENVLNALMVLSSQMEDTTEMLEEEQTQTMDTVFNGYLTLPVLIASLILGYFTAGAQDWFQLQFANKWPLLLLFISTLGVIFSFIIAQFLKRPKNDL